MTEQAANAPVPRVGIVGKAMGGLRKWRMRRHMRGKLAKADRGAVKHVEHVEDLKNVPWEMQGRDSFYADDMVAKRLKLRRQPSLLKVLEVWWITARRTMPDGTPSAEVVGPDTSLALSKAQYVTCSKNIYRAVVEEWDEADATAIAEEQWAADSDGVETMSRDFFMDSIFEFADVVRASHRSAWSW